MKEMKLEEREFGFFTFPVVFDISKIGIALT
jgi:hypothetical protein